MSDLIHTTADDFDKTISSGASVMYENGGLCTSATVLNGGTLVIGSCGCIEEAEVSAGGLLLVSSAGELNGANVHLTGHIEVCEGGYASNVDIKGVITMHGGVLDEARVDCGILSVYAGKAMDIEVNGGHAVIAAEGSAFGIKLDDDCIVGSGGIAEQVLVKDQGKLRVRSGGIVRNVTITPGGRMYVDKGAIISGIQSEREMVVSQADDDMVIIG